MAMVMKSTMEHRERYSGGTDARRLGGLVAGVFILGESAHCPAGSTAPELSGTEHGSCISNVHSICLAACNLFLQ